MEQIYYTQCPIGYGLGASNGFQVKRATPGYSFSSDFRHLGLRALPSGGRTLAPPALRYRRVEGRAEIAWLTPRMQEYETERGLWGRPGGHFAHGIVLDPDELAAIGDWPAGLFDRPLWRRSDRDPSRGRLPEPIELAEAGTFVTPSLNGIAPLAFGVDRDWLAGLLTAVATLTREGRTLFLIDEPDRLGPMVALLTFLFPPPLRAELTFSTYHDRPEELPGYRIHGTTITARPNRAILLTQGLIADGRSRTFEPRVSTAGWALAVIDWLSGADTAAWTDFARRLAESDGPDRWDADHFDRLIAFGRALKSGVVKVDWSGTADLLRWAAASNLADEWTEARGPKWWMTADPVAPEGRTSLVTLSSWAASWRGGRAAAWGRAVGRWFLDADVPQIEDAVLTFARNAPNDRDRLAFLLAVRLDLPIPAWIAIRRRLREEYPAGSAFVVALGLPEALASAISGHPQPLQVIGNRFGRSSSASVFFLELASAEAARLGLPVEPLGNALESFFEGREAFHWALGRSEGDEHWLNAFLRRRLATPEFDDRFEALLGATPPGLAPALSRSMLKVAADPGLPEGVFNDVIDDRLMVFAHDERPRDAAWAGLYLDRSPSDVDLVRRLYVRGPKGAALRAWLKSAGTRGELSDVHRERLVRIEGIARTLNLRDPAPVEGLDLSRIPERDRGTLLARWLSQQRPDFSKLLDRCADDWAASLRPGSPDLPQFARAIAESSFLISVVDHAETWLHRLAEILRRLDPSTPESSVFGAEGLAALVVATATRGLDRSRAAWSILEHLLNGEAAWKSIALALGDDLDGVDPAEAPAVIGRWDAALYKRHPSRFWEVALNGCDGRRLASIVGARAADLETVGHLSWWEHRLCPGARDDLRDAYARLMPLRPIEEGTLCAVEAWMSPSPGDKSSHLRPVAGISPLGLARWTCIVRLSREVDATHLSPIDRRFHIREWCHQLPLSEIAEDDRYRLLAWVIRRLDDPSTLDVNPVGKWLVKSGLTDLNRVTRWYEELGGLIEVSAALVHAREDVVLRLGREMKLVIQDQDERERSIIWVDASSD